jgi:alkanesulfonate monooxygenase SsuD/methylene tetrahydromethanopterin reductase-like flavin-dependent oxidoreductase (luciferase family)
MRTPPTPRHRRRRAADEYEPALHALRQETEEAGRDPDAVEPAVVVFARVGADDEAPVHGARWLSDMYGVPPKAFERHLVAGEPETCAVALQRYADAGARHIVVMIAAPGAVGHFGLLRSAFVAHADAVPVGVSG